MTDVSVCVAVYRIHDAPNVAGLVAGLDAALGDVSGELVVALNGVSAADTGLPDAVRSVDLGVNRGLAPGWNAAAVRAAGDVLVFANDDVVLGEGALQVLHAAATSGPDVGVVGPVGARWDLRGAKAGELVAPRGAPGTLAPCDVVSGFLLALRREVFDATGGFDEFYAPCSFEEVDLCAAVSLRLGLECLAVAGVAHEHEFGISLARPWTRVRYDGRSETLRSIHRRNRRHYLAKWSGDVA